MECEHCLGTGETIDSKKIGHKLRKRRETLGMSQRDMAKQMRVSQNMVHHLERGTRHWTTRRWKDYIRILDTTAS